MNKFYLLLVLIFTSFGKIHAQSDVPQSERAALIDFYNNLDGDYWTAKTNWKTDFPVSNWYGITVSTIDGTLHVTQINLNYNFLTGDIPASIANLKYLETLNIESNNIKSIPKELGTTKIKRLSPRSNPNLSVDFEIFNNNFNNLTYLDLLGCNHVTGDVSKFGLNKPNLSLIWTQGATTGDVDFSQNKLLTAVIIRANTINLKNGTNFPNLAVGPAQVMLSAQCIAVDDPIRANAGASPYSNWSGSNYQSDCSQYYLGTQERKKNLLSVYPNPTTDVLKINTDVVDKAFLYDLNGRLLKTVLLSKGENSVNVSELAKGLYIVKVGEKTAKIVKQ